MIKKKPYEKQNNKTLYDNQQNLIYKQGDFNNYGLESEYGFSARRMDIRRQARNIIPYKTLEELWPTYNVGEISVNLPYGNYLVTWYWTTTWSGDVDLSLDGTTLLTVSGNQISVPINVTDAQQTFAITPQTNTGTRTYNIIFISL